MVELMKGDCPALCPWRWDWGTLQVSSIPVLCERNFMYILVIPLRTRETIQHRTVRPPYAVLTPFDPLMPSSPYIYIRIQLHNYSSSIHFFPHLFATLHHNVNNLQSFAP